MAERGEGVAKSRGHHIKGGQNQIPEKGGKLCKTCRLLRGGKRGRICLEFTALKVSSIPLVLYCYLYLDLYCVFIGQIQFLITSGLYVCVIFSKSFWYFMIQHSSLIGFPSSIKSLDFYISLLTFILNWESDISQFAEVYKKLLMLLVANLVITKWCKNH